MANDRDFIVKNDLQVKGTGVSTFDSSDVTVGGNLIVKADSSADLLTVDSDGVTLASPGIFTGDGSGLTNVTSSLTNASIFELSNVDSSGITPIQDYVLAFDSATQTFIPSAAVAVLEIENDSDVLQAVRTVVDLGDLKDVDSAVSTSPANNNVLQYNSTTSLWEAAAAPASAALATVGTTSERNAIASPDDGALFYDTDEDILYVFDGVDWVESVKKYSSFEFIQPGNFSGSITPTATFEPITTISLRNLRAVTADSSHGGINFTINKNGTALGNQTFTIPNGQLRLSSDFNSTHTITDSDDITLAITGTGSTARILAVEVFYS